MTIPGPVRSRPRAIRGAVVFTGHSGSGKSFICNEIFKACGNPIRFSSGDSNLSVTNQLQHNTIHINGESVTIIDSPGFLDNGDPGRDAAGRNTCKLVKVLESVDELRALVYVYNGPFTKSHKIWFDRMTEIVNKQNQDKIVLLRNKATDPKTFCQMRTQILQILGRDQEYMMLEYNPHQSIIKKLMDRMVRFDSTRLDNLVVPNVCYEKVGESEPYEEELSRVTSSFREIGTKNHQEIRIVKERRRKKLLGFLRLRGSKWVDVPKVFDLKSEYWVEKEETTRVLATFVNVYNIRFDGSKDLAEKKIFNSREEKYGADVFLI